MTRLPNDEACNAVITDKPVYCTVDIRKYVHSYVVAILKLVSTLHPIWTQLTLKRSSETTK